MALSSMTGFARSHDASGAYAFEWELRSVNAKGFDFRLRLPPGWDAIEPAARKRATETLARGTVYANLTVKRADAAPLIRVNEDVLASVMKVAADLSAKLAAPPPTVDGILAIKGVLEVSEPNESEADRQAAEQERARHPEVVAGILLALRLRILVRLEAVNVTIFTEDSYRNAQIYQGGLGVYF